MNAKRSFLSILFSTLGGAIVALTLAGVPAGAVHAQVLSCQGYRELSSEQRQYYTLGFVEGISFTHLDLRARAEAAGKNAAATKDKKPDNDRLLVLQVMEGVAGNIELAVPHNLTVGQVMDKLLEICNQDPLREAPFLDAYYQYFQALLASESVRRAQVQRQAQEAAAAEKAKGGAAPKKGDAKKDEPKPAANKEGPKPATPPKLPAEAPKPAVPPKLPAEAPKPATEPPKPAEAPKP